jgi:hypothetical protein
LTGRVGVVVVVVETGIGFGLADVRLRNFAA